MNDTYDEVYRNLNKEQKEAVETIDGPVMVVAGPGTGKTQILALRIGNILKKTDTQPESILCLTFTNSGVSAMRERLEKYIGSRSREIHISTFHSFAIDLIERHYELLDFKDIPKLLDDNEAVFLVDQILNENDWEHISPLSDRSMYFGELKHLVSILKRERITAEVFLSYINSDIENLETDPDSISSRGESKGELKKEIIKKISSLKRTKEVVLFYRIYEEKKRQESLMDYDDVLEYIVYLVENFTDIRDDIRENYLYVLVDEHQDSSGIQNSFLKAVWAGVDSPNLFVVGDDRQLIYGFSGANISYFEEFSHIFGKIKLIVLTENYRSTKSILLFADDLLQSSVVKEKLNSNKIGNDKINLGEFFYPRDEIIGAGLYFKEKINKGIDPSECALLLPRNYQVKTAIEILSNMGLPVSSGKNISLFSQKESDYFIRLLTIIANPNDSLTLSKTLLDSTSGIKPIDAHMFMKNNKLEHLSINDLINSRDKDLFTDSNAIHIWGKKLENWINKTQNEKLSNIVNILGNEFLINTSENNNELLTRVEIVRSFIHLAIMFEEKNRKADLATFLEYLNRLDSYNTHIELAKFGNDSGIEVMTLHKSKGLEYEAVWIAHMNEEVLLSEKKGGFSLPEKIKEHINKRSIEEAKRELYVAITRAKSFCNLSYSKEGYRGNAMELVSILRDLADLHFDKKTARENEENILSLGAEIYTSFNKKDYTGEVTEEIKKLVKDNYSNLKVSVSMLNNFFECPWKWYFRSFLRLPELKPPYLSLGTAVHETIEYILKEKNLPTDKEIEKIILKVLEKEELQDKKDLNRLAKKASSIIFDWINNYYKKINKNYKTERSVSLRDKNFPHLLLYGKIDLSEYLSNTEIMVTDFKTGKSKTKNEIEKINDDGRMSDLMRQLSMYSYLLEGDEKNVKVVKSRLLFLEEDLKNKNCIYETYIDQEKIDLLKKDILDYDLSVSLGSWQNNKCNFKPYKSGDECQYCKLSQNLLKT